MSAFIAHAISVSKTVSKEHPMRLTDLSVRNLTPPKKGQKIHFDDTLPNFGIRISPRGTRSWVIIVGENRSVRTIGRYPNMSLRDARRTAKAELASPRTSAPAAKDAYTFDAAVKRFLDDCERRLAPRTLHDYRTILRRNFPFGNENIHTITSAKLRKKLDALRDKPAEQRHAHATIRVLFRWALRHEIVTVDPTVSLPTPPPQRSRDRVLSDSELTSVYAASCDYPYPFGPLIRLLCLLGQRRGEIAQLQWQWIDFSEKIITFPADSVKNRTIHYVPISGTAYSILENLPQETPYVFPSRSYKSKQYKPFANWRTAKENFDKKLNNVEAYTLHDLRRTFASQLARLGTPIHVTEALLNHRSGTHGGIVGIYQRYDYMKERRDALDRLEQHLETLIQR